MKLAVVSQSIDCVLPPYQNSVGFCTYGTVQSLPKDCQVLVCSSRDANEHDETPVEPVIDGNVRFEFFPLSTVDKLAWRAHSRLSKLLPLQPISVSELAVRGYGRQIAQRLSREQFDVIHIQHSVALAPVIREHNPHAKIVLHLHAEWFSQHRNRKVMKWLDSLDLISTVSDYVSDRVRTMFPDWRKPVVTHYNGIDPGEFQLKRDYAAQSRSPVRRLMFAGGLSPHKAVHVLIDAFNIVGRQRPDVQLEIFGPPGVYPFDETFDTKDAAARGHLAEFYPENRLTLLQKLTRRQRYDAADYVLHLENRVLEDLRSRVSFRGKVSRHELLESYRNADVFVFPSLFAEGFGLPPVEAMASGTPVVATRSGAMVETVRDGRTGFLVDKNNPKDLADAILKLVDNPDLRQKMGEAGRARALELFSWQRVTAKLYETYSTLSQRTQVNV